MESYHKTILAFDNDTRKLAAEKVPDARFGEKIEVVNLGFLLDWDEPENIISRTIIADGRTTSPISLNSDFHKESRAQFR